MNLFQIMKKAMFDLDLREKRGEAVRHITTLCTPVYNIRTCYTYSLLASLSSTNKNNENEKKKIDNTKPIYYIQKCNNSL